ncbi:hypothetical protein IAQ61_001274 [Plenodomus lingam]|nr:hypothetical protein IAQ61_001274 [Plenodomus lingam]
MPVSRSSVYVFCEWRRFPPLLTKLVWAGSGGAACARTAFIPQWTLDAPDPPLQRPRGLTPSKLTPLEEHRPLPNVYPFLSGDTATMDSAYDHIQEESYPQDPTKQQSAGGESTHQETTSNFNAELQDAYKAISSSPWAARLGGFLGTVKKQGEQYYDTASKQYAPLTKNATAGVSSFISHARNLSAHATDAATASSSTDKSTDKAKEEFEVHPDRPESLPADIVKEAENILSRFRFEAKKRLKDIEKAEDAADEALLKFGSNISNFLRDAVTIAPPASGSEAEKNGDVLFESKDSSGKKVVHATRFDAQLHVIHSTIDSFLKDPASPEWEKWKAAFNIDAKTDAIAKDLEKHQELRSAMEKCVPEKVEYGVFWCRYYFLRHVIESEETRRREMLKASAPIAEEEVAWDEDSEDESEDEAKSAAKPSTTSATKPTSPPTTKTTPTPATKPPAKDETSDESEEETSEEEEEESDDDSDDSTPSRPTTATPRTAAAAAKLPTTSSSTTPAANLAASTKTLKPEQPRRSNDEKSVADSDASYDVVSGATSRAPGSPAVEKKKVVDEESDEEDWE